MRLTRDDLVADDFDPLSAIPAHEGHALHHEMRAKCPVAHTSAYRGYWLLTRYDDIKSAAMNSSTFISSRTAVIPSDPRGLRRPPLNFDAPHHTPFRTALDRTLKPARLRRLEQILEVKAEACLAPLLEAGGGELTGTFGAHYPAEVEVAWLNLDDSVGPRLAEVASKWVMAWRRMDADEVSKHSGELYDMATALLADRKVDPRDPEEDPASSLLCERDAKGQPLNETHLIGALRQSLVVGLVAPPIILGSIAAHLAKDPALQDELRNDPARIPAAVEEFLRLYTPYRGFARTVTSPLEMHGRLIRPDEPVAICYAAGNRDPSVFADPDTFNMDRPNASAHLGFGRGPHRCAGAPLARIMINVAVRTLLAKTKSFEVDRTHEVTWATMPEMGPTSCHLYMVPA